MINLIVPMYGKSVADYISTFHLGYPTRGEKYIHQLVIKQIAGTVAGDSSLQDRGVAHYLLPLLFSLVSLLSSFFFRFLYQKPHKN